MQNSERKEDLRVRRSRKLIQEAMIELTVEKQGFAAVTVRDITERAMVNRSTFYRHFVDKYDLVSQYMEDVCALTENNAKVTVYIGADKTPRDIPAGLLEMLKHVQSFAEFYQIMLSAEGDLGFAESFRKHLAQRFRMLVTRWGNENDQTGIPSEMRVKYVAYADIGAIVWWLENDQPCSVEQLTVWISQLSYPIWSGQIPDDLPKW